MSVVSMRLVLSDIFYLLWFLNFNFPIFINEFLQRIIFIAFKMQWIVARNITILILLIQECSFIQILRVAQWNL